MLKEGITQTFEVIDAMPPEAEFDKPGEECGVFGIYAPTEHLPQLTYLALMNLQHRGQQGAGISQFTVGGGLEVAVGHGLVKNVFGGKYGLSGFDTKGVVATGHTRYGTINGTDSGAIRSLQPMRYTPENGFRDSEFTLSHNGHLEDIALLAKEHGVDISDCTSDTAILTNIIGAKVAEHGDLTKALLDVLPQVQGAYSLVLSTRNQLIAARDPQGFRPLNLGRYDGTGWTVASEIAAFMKIGAEPVREIAPGEILVIDGEDESGLSSLTFAEAEPALCAFEFVYFSRGSNEMFGETVIDVRNRMGSLLGARDTVSADLVVGVPNSGIHAADGYGRERNMPHIKCLEKNDYTDRTFIAPTQHEREQGVYNKLLPIPSLIKDKKVVVVDDSIVRGTTTKSLVNMLRQAGASEVHIRISSPPYRWPCYFGMDTGRRDELIAASRTIDEIRDYIDADSLEYLTDEELQIAVGRAAGKVCTACTTGIYPVEIKQRS